MRGMGAMNKILISIFVVVVAITSILLFILFNKQKSIRSPSSSPSPAATGTSDRVSFSPDARRAKTGNKVYYFLKVVLVDKPSFDLISGDALGSFYFQNDPAKNIFKYRLMTQGIDKFQIGLYFTDFQSKSNWNIRSKSELIDLAQPGAIAEIRGGFDLTMEDQSSAVTHIEEVFQLFSESYGKRISVPEGFTFEALQIGFAEK